MCSLLLRQKFKVKHAKSEFQPESELERRGNWGIFGPSGGVFTGLRAGKAYNRAQNLRNGFSGTKRGFVSVREPFKPVSHYSLTSETLLTMPSKLRLVVKTPKSSPEAPPREREDCETCPPCASEKTRRVSGEVLFGELNGCHCALPASLVRDESEFARTDESASHLLSGDFRELHIKRRCKFMRKVFLQVTPEKQGHTSRLCPS